MSTLEENFGDDIIIYGSNDLDILRNDGIIISVNDKDNRIIIGVENNRNIGINSDHIMLGSIHDVALGLPGSDDLGIDISSDSIDASLG